MDDSCKLVVQASIEPKGGHEQGSPSATTLLQALESIARR